MSETPSPTVMQRTDTEHVELDSIEPQGQDNFRRPKEEEEQSLLSSSLRMVSVSPSDNGADDSDTLVTDAGPSVDEGVEEEEGDRADGGLSKSQDSESSPPKDDECQQLLPTPATARRLQTSYHQHHSRPRHHLLKSAADLRVRMRHSTSSSPPDVFHSVDDLLAGASATKPGVAPAESFHTAAATSLGPSANTLSTPVFGSNRKCGGESGDKGEEKSGHHAIEVELQRRGSTLSSTRKPCPNSKNKNNKNKTSSSPPTEECCSVHAICGPSPWKAVAVVAAGLAVWAMLVVGMNWQKRITTLELELSTLSEEVSQLRMSMATMMPGSQSSSTLEDSVGRDVMIPTSSAINNKRKKKTRDAKGKSGKDEEEDSLMCVRGGDRCVFPFKFRGELYYECTTVNSRGDENAFSPWCATSVDPLSHEMNGPSAWGRCKPCKESSIIWSRKDD